MYPINLDLAGKKVLVVGGGKVAYRKIKKLLAAKAKLLLVSPRLETELKELISNNLAVDYYQRKFKAEDITKDLVLVFALTDNNKVNERIAQLAKEKEILVNLATKSTTADFYTPALIRRGGLLLTVATSGISPGLSKEIRKSLEEEFGEEYTIFLELMKEIRTLILEKIDNELRRKEILYKLVNLDLIGLLAEDKKEGIKRLKAELPKKIKKELSY